MTNEINSASEQPNGWEQARLFVNDELVKGRIILFREQANDIRVEIPSTFTGTMSLNLLDAGGLNITASPNFDVAVDLVDNAFRWQVTPVDGKSGEILLGFSSPDVVVQWRYPCSVRSDYVGDDAALRYHHGGGPGDYLFFRVMSDLVELVSKSGADLTGMQKTMSCRVYPPLLPGDVACELFHQPPTYGWAVGGTGANRSRSGEFDLTLEFEGIPKPLIVLCTLVSESLEDEATIKVGDKDIPPGGYVYFRDRPVRISFTPNPGSPIKKVPVWLEVTAESPLVQSDIKSAPDFGVEQVGESEWEVTGLNRSGNFQLTFMSGYKGAYHHSIAKRRCKLLSRNLEDEVVVLINGKEPVGGMKFAHGVSYLLTLRLKEGSPLEGHALQLHCAGMEEFNDGDLECAPGFDLPQTSNYGWLLTAVQGFGKFQLSLTGEGMDKARELPIFRLGREDLSDFFEVWFDGKRLADGEKALATRYGRHTIALMPKSGAPEGKVKLDWGTTDPELGLEFTPSLGTAQTVDPIKGATWSAACLGVDGEFSLKAELEGSPLPPLEIPVSLQAGSNKMRFTFLGIAQPYPPVMVTVNVPGSGTGWGVKPSVSVTTQEGEPVPGVKVEFITPDHPIGYGITGTNGSVGSSVTVRYYPEEERVVEFLAKTTEETGRVSMIRFLIKLVPAKPAP